jgi:hypothetical protein
VPSVVEKLTLDVAVTIPVLVIVTGSTCDSSPGNAEALNCIVVVGDPLGLGVGVGTTVGVGLGDGVPQLP